MIDKLLAMPLVACDRRRNPAADLVARSASSAFDSLVKLFDGMCPQTTPIASSVKTRETEGGLCPKIYTAMTATGQVVTYCKIGENEFTSVDQMWAPVSQQLPQAAKIPHYAVTDYTAGVRAQVDQLCKAYFVQKKEVDQAKAQIESHERIDLTLLYREIEEHEAAIESCRTAEDELTRQRQGYRSEGSVRNVLLHGFAQYALSRKMTKLRERKASLVARQERLRAQVDERQSFDFVSKKSLLKEQVEKLNLILRQYNAQKIWLTDCDRKLKCYVDRISETVTLLNREIDRYNILKEYEAELNAASNSYERFLVHKKCEERFGDGAVGRLRGRSQSCIRKLARRYDEQNQVALWHAQEIGLQV